VRIATVGALTLGLSVCCSSIAAAPTDARADDSPTCSANRANLLESAPGDPIEFCRIEKFGATELVYGIAHMTTQDGGNMHAEIHISPQLPNPPQKDLPPLAAVTATASMQNSSGAIYSIYKTAVSNSQTGYTQVIIAAQYASAGPAPSNADVWCSFVLVAPTVVIPRKP
jgi:hypothetical protein